MHGSGFAPGEKSDFAFHLHGATGVSMRLMETPFSPFTFEAPGRLIDFMRQAGQPGLINLAAGVPGLDALPVPALTEAFHRAGEHDGRELFTYHRPEGDPALRELIAARLTTRGVPGLSGDDVIMTTGCTQALQLMLAVLVQPGDIVACEAPGYYGLLELIAAMGARVLPIPVGSEAGIDLEQTRELLHRWTPKCFVICPLLSNPSGASMPLSARKELVEICRSAGVRLLEDDIYAELTDGGAPPPCRAFDDGSTVSFVTSFSKTLAPALRAGYCLPGTPELYEAYATKKCQQDLHSSTITEGILREFLAADGFDPHLDWLRPRYAARRAVVMEAVREHLPAGSRLFTPEGGFLLWVTLPEGTNLPALRAAALERGVAFAAGNVFYPSADLPGATHSIRLNCARAEEADLARGIAIIGELLKR